jgi:hypothetical protein
MVIGPDFVWLHFPKCGGHTVETALRAAARWRGDFAFDPVDYVGWHDSIPRRLQRDPQFDPSSKAVICGIRRLPFWILSRVHYEAARPPFRCATREMVVRGEFFEQDGNVNTADGYAAMFMTPPVDCWIRLEHLAEDFRRHFRGSLGRRMAKADRILSHRVNETGIRYLRSLEFHFTPRDLALLYAANPIWASLERRAYGDLLTVADRAATGEVVRRYSPASLA